MRLNTITCDAAIIECETTVQQKGGKWQQALCSWFQVAAASPWEFDALDVCSVAPTAFVVLDAVGGSTGAGYILIGFRCP